MTRKKQIDIEVIYAGTPEQTGTIIRSLLKNAIEGALKKNGAIAYNLDEVLDKYISEEICNPLRITGAGKRKEKVQDLHISSL